MVEVTRKNFELFYPEIVEKIEKATFLAVDSEFTGIYSVDSKCSKSLFDTAPQRYEKLKSDVSKFTSCQFGLAIFRKDLDSNTYFIDAYNFYLFPVAFDAFAKRDLLICQISCINFLARHNFDFNKFIKEGIPYLNQEKADSLRTFLQANRHFMNTCEYLDKDYFPDRTQKLTDEDIDDIIDRLAGFTKVIDRIHGSGKPVVGHNCLTDFLLTYQLFWDNLPKTYAEFKVSISQLFPTIYDTKYLSREVHSIRRGINEEDFVLSDSNLFSLYTSTYSVFELNTPLIECENSAKIYHKVLQEGRSRNLETLADAACHSAGFDAVVTGCVFLNLCYMAARPIPKPSHRRGLPPTFTELLGRTEIWRNKINIARAIVPYINLAGPDPISHRPNWIHVKSIHGKSLDPAVMKLELVRYGDIEVEAINDKQVLIACGAMGCYRRVWGDLKRKGFILSEQSISGGRLWLLLGRLNVGFKFLLGVGVLAIAVTVFKRS